MAAIGDNTIEMDDIENFALWFCAGSLISESKKYLRHILEV